MREDRQRAMMEYLLTEKRVRTEELCRRFGVSAETIRRDLRAMERSGFVRRAYGGAVLIEDRAVSEAMPAWESRVVQNLKEKQAIAREAIRLIPDGATIALDDGTTVMELARLFTLKRDLTIITNCMRVASEISARSDHSIYFIGGVLKKGMLVTTGFLADEFLHSFAHIDIALLSADGFDMGFGITDHADGMAVIKRTMAEKSDRLYCLADHSKFTSNAMFRSVPFDGIDLLITDDGATPDEIHAMEGAGVAVRVAPRAPQV